MIVFFFFFFCAICLWVLLPDLRVKVVKSDVYERVFGLQLAKVLRPPGGDGYGNGTWLFVVFAAAVFPDAAVAVAIVIVGRERGVDAIDKGLG